MKRNSSNRKYNSGFTLVELIVVIAILAILAGVGAVGYGAYIEYAKKGQDKATVGEIMHALELADYADPTLFGESGGAMIVLSKDGIQAAGGTVGSDIDGALKDAFGNDLKSTKLSYDSWPGTPDLSIFDSLPTSGAINGYLSKLNENPEDITSYAGHVDEIWDIVTTLVNGLNGGTLSDDIGVDYGGNGAKQDYLDKIVSRTTNADKDAIKNAWTNGGEFVLNDPTTGRQTAVELGATLARNYAFCLYAQNHEKYDPATMGEQLEKLKVQGAYSYTDTINSKNTHYFSGGGEDWTTIVNDYKTNAAKQDAQAYLAMMEAASTAKGEDELKDTDYLDRVSTYTGMVDNILTGAVDLNAIKTLASSATGNVIAINVTKVNGKLNFKVSPPEANPREEDESNGGNASDLPYTGSTATITFNGSGNSYTSSQSIVMSSTDPAYNSCTITFKNSTGALLQFTNTSEETFSSESSNSNVQFDLSTKTVTVKAGASKGSATITITSTDTLFGETITYTFTVIVQ